MVESTCFALVSNKWEEGFSANGGVGLKQHAEPYAYNHTTIESTNTVPTYAFSTNDFPCQKCTRQFFNLAKNKKSRFVFWCTGNEGGYAMECGFLTESEDKAMKPNNKAAKAGKLYIDENGIYAEGKIITLDKDGVDSKKAINVANTTPTWAANLAQVPTPKKKNVSKKKKS